MLNDAFTRSAEDRRKDELEIRIPRERVDQDGERCEVRRNGRIETIRFHDYDQIYRIPGLYEKLFCEALGCRSPAVVTDLLIERLAAHDAPPAGLRCLDVGAGNGMVGAALRERGVSRLVGIDILKEAAAAAHRDRPGLYEHYVVGDLTDLAPEDRKTIETFAPNALSLVAALGFGDIPAAAFLGAWKLVSDDAWVAINIKDRFLQSQADESGFARLMRDLIRGGHFEVETERRYVHRKATSGEPLYYVALIGRKRPAGTLPEPAAV